MLGARQVQMLMVTMRGTWSGDWVWGACAATLSCSVAVPSAQPLRWWRIVCCSLSGTERICFTASGSRQLWVCAGPISHLFAGVAHQQVLFQHYSFGELDHCNDEFLQAVVHESCARSQQVVGEKIVMAASSCLFVKCL